MLACSALKRRYRKRLEADRPDVRVPTLGVRTANLSTEEKFEPPMNPTERSEMDEHFDSKMSQMDTDLRQLILQSGRFPFES